jgi:subtilisin family serine protease
MRSQPITTQQPGMRAVRLTATQPIIHSNIGAQMRNFSNLRNTNLRLAAGGWRLAAGGLVLAALNACGGGGGSVSPATSALARPVANISTRTITDNDVALGDVTGIKHAKGEILVTLKTVDDWGNFQKFLATKNGWGVITYIEGVESYTIAIAGAPQESQLRQHIAELNSINYVLTSSLNTIAQGPNSISGDPSWQSDDKSWNMRAIRLPEARDLLTNPRSVVVGVVDSRFNTNHEDVGIFSEVINTGDVAPGGLNGVRGSKDTAANENHGMHVSGIINAYDNTSGLVGINPNAGIIGADPYQHLNGYATTESTRLSITKLIDKGVKIINLSLGFSLCENAFCGNNGYSNTFTNPELALERVADQLKIVSTFVDYANKKTGGALFIQSSGNSGDSYFNQSESTPAANASAVPIAADHNGYFATALSGLVTDSALKALQEKVSNNVIIVGAYGQQNTNYVLTKYTQTPIGHGISPSYLDSSFILAPGGDADLPVYSAYYTGYGYMYGTSMAAPHVSGVAALVMAANSKLTIAEVRTIILKGSDAINNSSALLPSYRGLNAEKAVRAARIATGVPTVTGISPENNAVVGTTTTFNITGANLPATATLDITFNGCADIQFVSQSAAQHQFTCTPNVAGTLTAVIRTLPGTTPLGSFTVAVSAAPASAITTGPWEARMGDTTKYSTKYVDTSKGYVTYSGPINGWAYFRSRFNTVLPGDNFRLELKAKNDPNLGGWSAYDLDIYLLNDFLTNQFDAYGVELSTRYFAFVGTNGYFNDFFLFKTDAVETGYVFQPGVLSTTAWHTYVLEVTGGVAKLYYDGVLKYSQTYAGKLGQFSTLMLAGKGNIEFDPASIKITTIP